MLSGAICLSHSPLMHHNRAPSDVEARWDEAVRGARQFIKDTQADLYVIFFPDHVNGFFYNLLPPFCIGADGESLGDFGTVPGVIDIPEAIAAECHGYCLAHGIDAAISYDMLIDHGGTQPFEMLADEGGLSAFLPIYVNCIAPPMPSFARAREFGRVVGAWAAARPERIVVIGSGGLSHDPPLPSLNSAQGATAQWLRRGGAMTYKDRIARQQRVLLEGKRFRSGASRVRPLNPEWDRKVLEALQRGDLDIFDAVSNETISVEAGNGAHELRTWIAALGALEGRGGYEVHSCFYEAVDEWITGMGLLTARPTALPATVAGA